jgi:hypothetical protein
MYTVGNSQSKKPGSQDDEVNRQVIMDEKGHFTEIKGEGHQIIVLISYEFSQNTQGAHKYVHLANYGKAHDTISESK